MSVLHRLLLIVVVGLLARSVDAGPSVPTPERLDQTPSLYVVVDTSRSMKISDPDRYAVLGAMILSDLTGDDDRLVLIRFPSTSEICSCD